MASLALMWSSGIEKHLESNLLNLRCILVGAYIDSCSSEEWLTLETACRAFDDR